MVESVGIIAFAFGQQGGKTPVAGPSNEAISDVTEYIAEKEFELGNDTMVAAQWETKLGIQGVDFTASEFNSPTHYISTKDVMDSSLAFFKQQGVYRVIFVAHPFHLLFIRLLIKADVWKVEDVKIDYQYNKLLRMIPYDRSEGNIQWWTGNPVTFVTYLVKAQLTKSHGS